LRHIADLRLPHFDSDRYFDSYQNYVIRTENRDSLREFLRKEGVETLVHWAKPMWEHKGLALSNPGLPVTERLCSEVLSLPMSAETTEEEVAFTVERISDYFASRPLSAFTRAAQ
jgi:dTDP-4-amino-4,6-dideoxygalactose transaminase